MSRLYFYSMCFNYNINTSFLPFPFLPPNLLSPILPLILIVSFAYYCYKHTERNKCTY